MFDHEHFERLLVEFQALKYDTHRNFQLGTQIMASLQDVQDAQAATAQAIAAIATRIIAPAATATDLDGLLATEQQNTAAANAIDPSTPAPAAA